MGNYVFTMNTYIRSVEYNKLTKPFVEGYYKRFKETPTYTADTYIAIKHYLVPSIEAVGSLDADKIVANLENRVFEVPSGTDKFEKNAQGRPTHDLTWGPGYLTSRRGPVAGWQICRGLAQQVEDDPDRPGGHVQGMVPIKLPPWMKK